MFRSIFFTWWGQIRGVLVFPVFSVNDPRFREWFNFHCPSDNNYFREDPWCDDPVLVTTCVNSPARSGGIRGNFDRRHTCASFPMGCNPVEGRWVMGWMECCWWGTEKSWASRVSSGKSSGIWFYFKFFHSTKNYEWKINDWIFFYFKFQS